MFLELIIKCFNFIVLKGVGFSFSGNLSDYNTDDATVTIDNAASLDAFFGRFPAYSKHDVFLAGESYGGHFVPLLALNLLQRSSSSNLLKGLIHGAIV